MYSEYSMGLPTPKFKVLLFGPGLPPAGVRARAHFEESILVIQGKGHWFTIQGDKLHLKTGGFDGRQWLLTWQTPSGLTSAMLQGDDAMEAFIELAPAAVSQDIKSAYKAHGKKNRPFRLGLALLFFALALVLIWAYTKR
jgi:hypothetical protein